jgi:hypothetical protein
LENASTPTKAEVAPLSFAVTDFGTRKRARRRHSSTSRNQAEFRVAQRLLTSTDASVFSTGRTCAIARIGVR